MKGSTVMNRLNVNRFNIIIYYPSGHIMYGLNTSCIAYFSLYQKRIVTSVNHVRSMFT